MKSILQDIQFGFNKGNNALRKLIIINVVVFIITSILGKFPFTWSKIFLANLALPHHFQDFIRQPWSLFTYIFLHANFWHLLSNMLWLFFIGEIFRSLAGNKHIYRTFLWGGISGGILYLIVLNMLPYYADMPISIRMVGASGGVTSVIIAAAVFTPDYELRPFGLFNIQLKWIAIVFIVYNLLALGNGENDGGILSHLGGALFGYLYVKWMRGQLPLPDMSGIFKRKQSTKKPQREFKVHINANPATSKPTEMSNQREIDIILDKISKSGYDSLSQKEKEILFKASKDL